MKAALGSQILAVAALFASFAPQEEPASPSGRSVAHVSRTTGVLYSDQGGMSGSATGEVVLRTNRELLRLAYARPYAESGFGTAGCRRVGAVWAVEYDERDPGAPKLTRAHCDGVSETIRKADELVRAFFRAVGKNDESAAAKLSDPTISVRALRREYGVQAAENGLAGSVGSTEVIRVQEETVMLYAYLDRLLETEGPAACCLVEVGRQKGVWLVRRVEEGAPP